MTQQNVAVSLGSKSANLLAEARRYAELGNRDKAYGLSLEATQKSPEDLEAWHLRANNAPSLEEKLYCLSRVYALDPYYPRAKSSMYSALRDLIRQEPFLGYIDETDTLYRIKSGLELYLNVPKSRAIQETYQASRSSLMKPTYILLSLAILGLLFGGIGAVFLAPLAIISAFLLQFRPLNRGDRTRSLIALLLGLLVWLVALPFGFLFLIHLIQ